MNSKEILTPSTFSLNRKVPKKIGRPLRIKPSFQDFLGQDFEFNLYVGFMETLIEKTIPEDVLDDFRQADTPLHLRKVFHRLLEHLPLFQWTFAQGQPGLLYINLLCPADFTCGVGRFICDTLSRWLIPGRTLPLICSPSLSFCFIDYPKEVFFIQHVILQLSHAQDLSLVKSRLPTLGREIRLTTLAVKHARTVMSLKHLSAEQKNALIQENLESLKGSPSQEFDHTIYEQMHQFLIKVSVEEKTEQLNQNMQKLLLQKPNLFSADIFLEVQHFVLLFRDIFAAVRSVKHMTRLIAFQYLFRKALKNTILHSTLNSSKDRTLSFKLLKTELHTPGGSKSVLGVLIGLNFLRETEVFEAKHILEALQHCLPSLIPVKDSYVADRREQDKIRLFYLEVEKQDGSPLSLNELKHLKKCLPREIKASVENVTHPMFMPRNEEEVVRNILLLSQELKYVKDIPQVVISFDAQTEKHLNFTVILVRILQPTDTSLQEFFSKTTSCIQFQGFDIKKAGFLRKKHPKEATVFTAKIDKQPFLRKDYSLDLFKARQAVSKELSSLLGDIRDFNGGILSKQHELFHELKESLSTLSQQHEYLLENFFYALTPSIMQSILPSPILKALYLMLLEALEHDFKQDVFFLKTHWDPTYLLLMIAAPSELFKETLVQAISSLKIPSSDLSFSFVKMYETAFLGYIYRCEDAQKCSVFYTTVQNSLQKWEQNV